MSVLHPNIKKALSSIILNNTFFSAILLQQKFVELKNDPGCPTAYVNGTILAYNPEFIDTLTFDEVKFILAHEALHLALCHHARMGSRDSKIWNYACDYAINSELLAKGFKLIEGCLRHPTFDLMSAEEIYRLLYQAAKNSSGNNKGGKNGGSGGKGGNNIPDPDAENGKGKNCGQVVKGTQTETEAKAAVMKAMASAKSCGADSADFDRVIKEMAPTINWLDILHSFFSEISQGDYSFRKPNKRYLHTGIVLPTLESRNVGKITLAVDTSASISMEEVSVMVAEILNCIETYIELGCDPQLEVIYCDSEIKGIEILTSGDTPKPKGGGGTDFRPVFRHLAKEGMESDCLVYLTDLMTSGFADVEPSFSVLWMAIAGYENTPVPFGEVVKFDIHA